MRSTAQAPGKLILCGEHAVVYRQPAIALPVSGVGATASVTRTAHGVTLSLPDLDEQWRLDERPEYPLSVLVAHTLDTLAIDEPPPLHIELFSTIPIASGMGSGAALGAALVRALAAFFGREVDPATVSALVYESERIYHGTPSGIDNTVVSYGKPVWYQRTEGGPPQIEALEIGTMFELVIGDTGVRCPTHLTVGAVRARFMAEPELYQQRFDTIGHLVRVIRASLRDGDQIALGEMLNENHGLLQQLGVSSPELDHLVAAAGGSGAIGAKLSGGGGGGIMIALPQPGRTPDVVAALRAAKAARVFTTRLLPEGEGASLV
jgi:mevalonate kinase